ncbi:MAG: cytochrome c biogenesis protein CcdA [Oscillospiraceae bacterium]|jgi:cytochrome c-type biogenesis protein|nr:cytochrome c biogenesis protein CcdA [Oscillospiraceae bacterium]
MQYLVLFLEGMLTFVSPCLLPMLPVYVTFFAAGRTNEDKKRALVNALGFVLGFTLVFVALGALAGALGGLLRRYALWVNLATGLVVALLGLNFLGVLKIGFLNRTSRKSANTKDLRFFSSLVFGLTFSVGWTPCVGAFLGSALSLASEKGRAAEGMLMLLVYCLGLGVPFVASAVLIDRLKGALGFLRRHSRGINIASGALLVVMGVLMATGVLGRILSLLSL